MLRDAAWCHVGDAHLSASPLEAALWLRHGAHGAHAGSGSGSGSNPVSGWALQSTRAEWATKLLRGRAADEAPRLLPSLYALCGGAHRLAAEHALAAARGDLPFTGDARQAQALRLDTLREHVRRLWLDAPRLAAALNAGPGPGAAELAGCPFIAGRGSDASFEAMVPAAKTWIEQRVLGRPVETWLAGWREDPVRFAAAWAEDCARSAASGAGVWPGRWLRAMRRCLGAEAGRLPRALRVAGDAASLRHLAQLLRSDPAFALTPTWHGEPQETGCWTRLADPFALRGATTYARYWMRHAARIAEVAHLASADAGRWLAQGGAPGSAQAGLDAQAASGVADGLGMPARGAEGLGWCEMARGLLVHWVRLDAAGRIAAYRVIAPTEWNFHPQGAAAQALTDLAERASERSRPTQGHAPANRGDTLGACSGTPGVTPPVAAWPDLDVAQMRALAAAYDPCVELHIDPAPQRVMAATLPLRAGTAPEAGDA